MLNLLSLCVRMPMLMKLLMWPMPLGSPISPSQYLLYEKRKELMEKARSKQLRPQEYNSGTFTLSNIGMFGLDRFDAILPPGQAC
nr:2-oxoacid dehydrogenase acyltransferase, catalytic domain-containing protein [Tanacetum cinerariifolium]